MRCAGFDLRLLACASLLVAAARDTLLHGQPMRRPSIKSMDIPPGMRSVVEQECNSSQVRAAAGHSTTVL
jgi:hypothetical protein